MKKLILSLIYIFTVTFVYSQEEIKGKVYSKSSDKKESLTGAYVYWANSEKQPVTTNEKGEFVIVWNKSSDKILVASFVGFVNDSIAIRNANQKIEFVLENSTLNEVIIEQRANSTTLNTLDARNMQTINQQELRKSACCNLSESFETNAAVDAEFSDAVTGARKIRMLGIEGRYVLISLENIPFIRGAVNNFGLNYLPGQWIENMQLIKGSGSVVNGFESMTGQINLELYKPEGKIENSWNVFSSYQGRFEANGHYSYRLNKKWTTSLMAHSQVQQSKWDMNQDSFLDNPLISNIHLLNRWKYQGKNYETMFGFRYLQDERSGGQAKNIRGHEYNLPQYYQTNNSTKVFHAFGKLGLFFPENPLISLGQIASFTYNSSQNKFGNANWDLNHQSFYYNMIFSKYIGNSDRTLTSGLALQTDVYNESFLNNKNDYSDIVPGVYSEFTYKIDTSSVLVLGARLDYHNTQGFQSSPKINFRKDLGKGFVFKIAAGRSWRMPLFIADNMSYFVSSRQLLLPEKRLAEIAWNSGVTLLKTFMVGKGNYSVSTDFFYTSFVNQLVVDLENTAFIEMYNLKGKSTAKSFHAELNANPIKPLDLRIAYRYEDVFVDYNKGNLRKPFTEQQRFLFNAAWHTKNRKWALDGTVNFYGKRRLPSSANNPENLQWADYSPSYSIVNSQATRYFKKFEVYGGLENILNFKQHHPVFGNNDPFGKNFDAAMVWGPIMGRNFYFGIRKKLN